MSTLPGGPADKFGNIHEALWGVVGMSKVLGGQADAIRIEEPGTDGAEFYLESAGIKEHWQAKRQVLSQKTWSLKLLKTEGILKFFWQRANAGESCVFASITDAPDLRGLSENARDAQDWSEFQYKFLAAACWKKPFDELEKYLGASESKDVFAFLRQVNVEGARESTLELLLIPIFKASFTGFPQTALAILRDLYTSSVHRKLTADDILKHLESHGITTRSLPVSKELRDSLQSITKTYIAGQRAKLIRGRSITRQTATDVFEKIKSSERSLDILVTASAGGGKSAGLLQVVEGLVAIGIPVLAFRLDRIEPVASTEALGQKLNLPESPAIVLSQCNPGQAVVLLIDQLDFVSATSGRHPDFFEVVAALAEEVRGMRVSRQIHLLMACRQFDFDNDSRIRRLLPANESPVLLDLLSDEEVRNEIQADGGEPAKLTTKQIDLLRLPQNLALFIDSGLGKENAPTFITQKELFDRYWDTKRRAVNERRTQDSAQWGEVIAKLTKVMSLSEELSVPKGRLDEFSPEFLDVMVAEGVLSVEGKRYGFGHESFFDYCFARNVAAGDIEFVAILENDQQELFRRAQLRQVLVYLRDDDFSRYINNTGQALASPHIRSHLKLLVLELIAAFPDPQDEEFNVLLPYLETEFAIRRSSVQNNNRIATRALAAFIGSRTLFDVADRLGYITSWLVSGEEWLEDQMAFYLRRQSEFHGDRVAELLEPFVGRVDRWKNRLRYIMEWVGGHLGKSRRLFDLFLQLLDDGTLDNARGPIASNSTFWSILYSLAKDRAAWYAEVAAHWLDRQVVIAQISVSEGEKQYLRLEDQFGGDNLIKCATAAPQSFLEHLLPAILRASESFKNADHGGLLRDRIWSMRFSFEYITLKEAYLKSCEMAIEQIGSTNPESLRPLITSLSQSRLYVANNFLLTALLAAPKIFAEEAMNLLADEPERFHCGFSNNPILATRTLVEKCSTYCSEECFQKVEKAILSFTSHYELSTEGLPYQGQSAYELASALAPCRISAELRSQLAEWQVKFGDCPKTSITPRCCGDVSPIPKEKAQDMSDEQWLQAIAKYNNEERDFDFEHSQQGGASELAILLREFVVQNPARFALLALRFPQNTNASYFMNVLYGLKQDSVDPLLKIEGARRVFHSGHTESLKAALDLLGTIVGIFLPDDAIHFIQTMATEHPDPEPSDTNEDDLLLRGINSVRGHALGVISGLIFYDTKYLTVFEHTIELCVCDPSLAVRACSASTILAVAEHDPVGAIVLFKQLLDADDILLTVPHVERFLAQCLKQYAGDLRDIIERMLISENKEAMQAGGRLACLARIYHPSLDELSELALMGNSSSRLGAAQIARQNLTQINCRSWCEMALLRLFNDRDEIVRREAARCFWILWHDPELSLADYNELITSFLVSQSFVEEPTFLLHALEATRQRVPEAILDICEMFVAKCSEQARDIRTSIAGDEMTVGKLVFRAYAQLKAMPMRKRALNLIDEMCAEGLQSAGLHLSEFER
ncbi:hypothetical protein G9409_07460 [Chlorobium sp. BLA1]|uniref:hypothetical protein n=1 Tax=Candidatus Chlorobium masyuteum TaxID=2716876 RepID=UPI00141E7EDA|nr:hypothetical protein [Candidatus Chlorobium masyuteum]NHQ60428.1 hypothetical protein [Candidatus Chlorobium masyuteum]